MIAKGIVTLVLVATCIQYTISEKLYLQSGNFPLPHCLTMDCKPPNDKPNDWQCELEGEVDKKTEKGSVYLKHLEGNNYRIVYESLEIKNLTLTITKQDFIRKIQLVVDNTTIDPNKIVTSCAAPIKTLNDAEKDQVKAFCNEVGMQYADNSNC